MSDAGASHVIFFVAAMVLATMVVGVISVNIHSISDASISSGTTLSKQIKTDITIISDSTAIPTNGSYRVFYVKNTGKTNLDINQVNIFVDGVYITDSLLILKVLDTGESTWREGEALEVNVDGIASGDHSLRVITENGIADTMDFRI
ncbi:MAG: Archaebacterial flagellin [Candidatus Syntrophoarchaeum sp. GoM_oil]|nr:MAG: Archaebacterial flagellin [Candidatus Syntrophoarchaeum sp. GoM_oil]